MNMDTSQMTLKHKAKNYIFYDLKISIGLENFSIITSQIIFNPKKIISTALMKENPVRSPIVPPIAESISTSFAALSFSILSNVVAPK